jgi:hypothetical protein
MKFEDTEEKKGAMISSECGYGGGGGGGKVGGEGVIVSEALRLSRLWRELLKRFLGRRDVFGEGINNDMVSSSSSQSTVILWTSSSPLRA